MSAMSARLTQADLQAEQPVDPVPTPRGAVPARSAREGIERRWRALPLPATSRAALADPSVLDEAAHYGGAVEKPIGAVRVPVGLAGPLRVDGRHARGDYHVPLATTEGALVASYNRGARLISAAGGCSAALLDEGVGRAPGFAFDTLVECLRFVAWAESDAQRAAFEKEAARTTRHGALRDVRAIVEGNHAYLLFDYSTGDAAGQNMVTIATDAVLSYIDARSPVRPRYRFVEANLSGDKKASARSFASTQGKRVTAEVTVPAELVRAMLHTTPARMADYWRMGAVGAVLGGTIGVQGHYANGLAALYIACGQDAACVAESAVGVTRFEETARGELYAAVTLPNLIVGTVGGGTGLPGQRACLEIMGLAGPGKARALAEVCAALLLAGELSLVGALCADEFARAHKLLARDARLCADGGGEASDA